MFITQPKIFISSTIVDLPNERKAALKAVEKAGGFPVMSEFTIEAQSTDSLTACLDKIKSSDIYVLILGGRYGWQPEGKESITEQYQTYPGMYIPAPLEIRIVSAVSSVKTVCREILGLTKMNWNNTQFDNKYPITIGCARKVGEIMKYLGEKDTPKESYAFYM